MMKRWAAVIDTLSHFTKAVAMMLLLLSHRSRQDKIRAPYRLPEAALTTSIVLLEVPHDWAYQAKDLLSISSYAY